MNFDLVIIKNLVYIYYYKCRYKLVNIYRYIFIFIIFTIGNVSCADKYDPRKWREK